ncbi:trafficking protein particle complex subunit 8 isoform X1 [Tanacetum coccineum]
MSTISGTASIVFIVLKASGQYKEAVGVYFRISAEEPLHSAIKHAIRAYRNALSVFKGTTWSRICDHVHFQIGKWYANLGRFDVAMKHMLEILACRHHSKTMQELFIKDFFQILQKTGKTYKISRLQLPIVNISSFSIVSEDHRTYGSAAAISVKENVGQSLEEEMVPSLTNAKTNWLDLQLKLLLYSANETLHDSSSSINQGVEDGNIATGREPSSDNSLFTLSEVDITLAGSETIVAHLTVIPKNEGRLRVTSVSWNLSNSMVGFYTFEPDQIKKRISKQKRKANQNISKLKFLVIKSLPRLEGVINNLPSTVYVGNLQRLYLELRNSSKIPIKNLKMKISHVTPRLGGNTRRNIMDIITTQSCLL